MIISKTPVRVSFFGGGTDYPTYFHEFGGSVVSTTINKYIYITVNKITGLLGDKYRIAYSKLELCNHVDDIEHPVVKAVIKYLQIQDGLDINIFSDLPSRTGIGSSSSFTVGLLHCLYAIQGIQKSKHELALDAIHVEYNLLQERVGVQDQLAAAHGGLNFMQFTATNLTVTPVLLSKERKLKFQRKLMMFYTGINRFASEILKEQLQKTEEKTIQKELTDIHDMVNQGLQILQDEHHSLDALGLLLNKAWLAKRALSSAISNSFLDDIYDRAIKGGALGGKLLGAGGGGFFLFYVPEENQVEVRNKLADLQEISFEFEEDGTQLIHRS